MSRSSGLRDAGHGAALGATLLAPGLSVATIAMVLGVYERLLASIKDLLSPRWRGTLRFLVPLGLGALTAVALSSRVLSWAEDNYPYQTFSLFLGLVVGAIPLLIRTVDAPRTFQVKHYVALALGFAAVAALEFAHIPETEHTGLLALDGATAGRLLIAGVLAGSAMLLPGLSAALVLLLTGTYSILLHAVAHPNPAVLAITAVGGVLGLALSSRGISFLLSRQVAFTYAASIGMVAGSSVVIFPGIPEGPVAILSCLAAFALGCALVLVVDRARTRGPKGDEADRAPSAPVEIE